MNERLNRLLLLLLERAPLLLFGALLLLSGLLSDRFLTNIENILVQASSIGIVAVGMTFVLLTAGIDLSVGSIMFLATIVGGLAINAGAPLLVGFALVVAVGALFGAVNAAFITYLRVIPFIVTLATFYVGRGLGLRITETRSLPLPREILELGAGRILGVPFPLLLFLIVCVLGHLVLTRTPFGRQIYAVGQDPEAAQKAGIPTRRRLFAVYVISGVCAAIGGFVLVAQLAEVASRFGEQKEFAAIAAAVLGGTSLFGGRGSVLPGAILGAVLIQTVENILVILRADVYVYPLVTSAVIFVAVLIDSLRHGRLLRLKRRRIRVEA